MPRTARMNCPLQVDSVVDSEATIKWEMNGPLKFLTARKILPLLDCSCSPNFCSCSHARFLVSIERKSKTNLHGFLCGFCGCVTLSNAFELHFCSYKHIFQRFTSFVGCFQQGLIFCKSPICHQCLFKIFVPLGDKL